MSSSLGERLKTETRALHTAAERSKFMRVLLRGEMQRSAYCALLANLQAIYAALEPALARHAQHPYLAPFELNALRRTPSIEADLEHWHGRGWRSEMTLQPATLAYVLRLRALDTDQPALLLAHAYVRYLGDLSGGQILRRIVARSLGAPEGAGTAFYEFGTAQQAQGLAQSFRAALGGLTPDAGSVEALVSEATRSFRLHRQLFHELARASGWVDQRAGQSRNRSTAATDSRVASS